MLICVPQSSVTDRSFQAHWPTGLKATRGGDSYTRPAFTPCPSGSGRFTGGAGCNFLHRESNSFPHQKHVWRLSTYFLKVTLNTRFVYSFALEVPRHSLSPADVNHGLLQTPDP